MERLDLLDLICISRVYRYTVHSSIMSFTPSSASSTSSSASSGWSKLSLSSPSRLCNHTSLTVSPYHSITAPPGRIYNFQELLKLGKSNESSQPGKLPHSITFPVMDSFFDIVRVPADHYGYGCNMPMSEPKSTAKSHESCWSSSDSLQSTFSESDPENSSESDIDASGAPPLPLTKLERSNSTSSLRSYRYGCGESVRTDLSVDKLRELRRAVRALSVDLSSLNSLDVTAS